MKLEAGEEWKKVSGRRQRGQHALNWLDLSPWQFAKHCWWDVREVGVQCNSHNRQVSVEFGYISVLAGSNLSHASKQGWIDRQTDQPSTSSISSSIETRCKEGRWVIYIRNPSVLLPRSTAPISPCLQQLPWPLKIDSLSLSVDSRSAFLGVLEGKATCSFHPQKPLVVLPNLYRSPIQRERGNPVKPLPTHKNWWEDKTFGGPLSLSLSQNNWSSMRI